MIKLVSVEAEGAHQSIRRARQKGMDAIKKAFKSASADDKKRTEKEVRRCNRAVMNSNSPCGKECISRLAEFHTCRLAAAYVAHAVYQ
jgi:ribosome recycling factor